MTSRTHGASRPLRIGAFLSRTGKYARFGRQAAMGLRAWQSLVGNVDLQLEDDAGEPKRIRAGLSHLASECDLLLGPYSTQLMRAAAQAMGETEGVLWNHGGSGDDVQASSSRRVVSVLTPTGRYGEPFLRHLAGQNAHRPLYIVEGRGSFGRQVASGAEALAREFGFQTVRKRLGEPLPGSDHPGAWDLFCAGAFEEDVATIRNVLDHEQPPQEVCAVAAGVQTFASMIDRPHGICGIAQWFPGQTESPEVGPTEAEFLAAYARLASTGPDYPAVQAVATAAIARHCAQIAGGVEPDKLWATAANLEVRTLFGDFKIDVRGTQLKHQTVLVRWTNGMLGRVQ